MRKKVKIADEQGYPSLTQYVCERRQFLRQINRSGTTIILTTHYLEEAERLCKHIAIINRGEIIEHSAMDSLLRKLHLETFVLNLRDGVHSLPELPGYSITMHPASLADYEFPTGSVWRERTSGAESK